MTRKEYLGYIDRVASNLASPVDARRLPEGVVVLPLHDDETADAVARIWRRIGISERSIKAQLSAVRKDGGGSAESGISP